MYDLRDRIKSMIEGAITDAAERQKLEEFLRTKRWNPYCIRHSAITFDSDHYPEYAVKKKARWSMNSKQGARYVKNKLSSDLRKAILKTGGILTEDDARPRPAFQRCGRCQEPNAMENKICSKCTYLLTIEGYEKIKAQENARIKGLEDQIAELTKLSQSYGEVISYLMRTAPEPISSTREFHLKKPARSKGKNACNGECVMPQTFKSTKEWLAWVNQHEHLAKANVSSKAKR